MICVCLDYARISDYACSKCSERRIILLTVHLVPLAEIRYTNKSASTQQSIQDCMIYVVAVLALVYSPSRLFTHSEPSQSGRRAN